MKGSDELKANAEKALKMKQEAEPQAHIPEHQASHEGEAQGSQFPTYNDRDNGSQGSYQPQLKRTRVARSGDAS